jgi:hypothetical protein
MRALITTISDPMLALLGELRPSSRPAVQIVPRSARPATTASPVDAHEQTLRAADALGRALAELELRHERWP